MDLKTVVADFAKQLSALIESATLERARAAVLSAFGSTSSPKPGRTPKSASLAAVPGPIVAVLSKTYRKGPVQLCPVPGCRNPVAPIFGMVCSDHKGLPKAKIRKYREARRAAKLAGKPAPKKRGHRPGPKVAPRKVAAKIAPKATSIAKKAPAKKAATQKTVTKKAAAKKAKPPVKKANLKKRPPRVTTPKAPAAVEPAPPVAAAAS